MLSLHELADATKSKAIECGFDACGIAPVTGIDALTHYEDWLAAGYAAGMTFLTDTAAQRKDARGVLPRAQSVIVTATLYNTDRPYSLASRDGAAAHIARYAWGDDYHRVLMSRLDTLIGWMHRAYPEPFEAAPYVDTGAIQERAYAQAAGLGWIGKNCCVIHPTLGSFLFLAEIVCSLPLPPDAAAFDRCGGCTLCIDACPTEALEAPRVLNAGRCVSYLTIEHRGEVPEPLQAGIERWVYGCDVCQEVCPFNAAAPHSADPAWQPRAIWDRRSVGDLAALSDAELRAGLVGSAMSRARAAGLRRNVRLASANLPQKR